MMKTVLLVLGGAAIGATAALLTAPMSGVETRRKLKQVGDDLAERASRVVPVIQEAYRKATVAGKEVIEQTRAAATMNSPAREPHRY